jgi:hypothetical protein
VESAEESEPRELCQPCGRLGERDNCESMDCSRRDVGRGSRNSGDSIGGRRLTLAVRAPADDVACAPLDRAAVAGVRRDVGRGSRNPVDGVGGRRPAAPVVAPTDDVTRAGLDRAAVDATRRDLARSSRNAVDCVRGRRLTVVVPTPADDIARARLDRAAVAAAAARRDGARGPLNVRLPLTGCRTMKLFIDVH